MQTELVRPGGAIPRPLRFARTSCALRAVAVAVGFLITPSLTAHADPVDGVRVGHASWYGQEFAQRPTASGELFDPNGLTAAHRTLPLGTRLRVTNLHNGRTVEVRITDRGPFRPHREIDLSYGAARALGMVRRGIARVAIEPLES